MVSASLEGEELPEAYETMVPDERKWDHSWASFTHALASGTASLSEELKKEELEIEFINVAAARLDGVLRFRFKATSSS